MPPDSLLIVSAIVLFAAAIVGWRMAASLRAPARMPLRFATMLLAALAVTGALRLGDVAALLLLPLAGTSLALATLARFARPAHTALSSVALIAALGLGLAAMLSGRWMLALAPLAVAALTIIAASFHGMAWASALAGASLLAAGLGLPQNGLTPAALLLCAASVIGAVRSAAAIDDQRMARFGAGIGSVQPRLGLAAFGKDLSQDLRDK